MMYLVSEINGKFQVLSHNLATGDFSVVTTCTHQVVAEEEDTMDDLTKELNALKLRFWQGETIETLARDSSIDPDYLRSWFTNKYEPKDVASTPDECTYIPGDEL